MPLPAILNIILTGVFERSVLPILHVQHETKQRKRRQKKGEKVRQEKTPAL